MIRIDYSIFSNFIVVVCINIVDIHASALFVNIVEDLVEVLLGFDEILVMDV